MIATRNAGLTRLAAFLPHMADDYATRRNYDLGVHSVVSRLSPFLRRRLITESEVVLAALGQHGLPPAAKFIDEVVWRSYFKGWLELRPSIWRDYCDGIAADLVGLDPARRKTYDDVLNARSAIACMDAWVVELTTTGYLHNHARLWFASIWVFSLGLPWRLGADFFLQHLLDGDPASNTLGWRWVAGLHTPGKTYQARADNIATFTDGRLAPDPAQIAPRYPAPAEPDGLPQPRALRDIFAPNPKLPTLLLITEEDCAAPPVDLAALNICAVVAVTASHLRSPTGLSQHVAAFETAALRDTTRRLGVADAPIIVANDPDALIAQAHHAGATQIVTSFVPTGPLQDWLMAAMPRIAAAGLCLAEWRRPWDDMIWPDCTAGFFKVKKNIPSYLAMAGLLPAFDAQKDRK